MHTFTCVHPDGFCCPTCGSDSIFYWPEIKDWDSWTTEKKKSYEKCPDCDYNNRERIEDDEL